MQIDGAEIASVCSHSWLSPDKQLSTTPQSAPSTAKQRHFVHTEWTLRWNTASAPPQWTLSLGNLLMRQRRTGVLHFCAPLHCNCCERILRILSSIFLFPKYLYYFEFLSVCYFANKKLLIHCEIYKLPDSLSCFSIQVQTSKAV